MRWRELRARVREAWATHGARRTNPGFWAVAQHAAGRFAIESSPRALEPLVRRAVDAAERVAELYTGARLPADVEVGPELHLIHTGLVDVHPDVVLGARVGLMQGVTIGPDPHGPPGAPVLEDDVFVGTHATILGRVGVGRGARVAANTLVTSDVPAGAVAIGVPAKIFPGLRWVRDAKEGGGDATRAAPPREGERG
jgi:serine O-acetyltransferase